MKDINYELAESISNEMIQGFVDKTLIDKNTQRLIDKIIEKQGKKIFSLIIYKLTHIKLQPTKAKEMWEGIVSHMNRLNKMLRREVGINVASMDYMVNMASNKIQAPVLVDETYLSEIKKNIVIDNTSGLYNANYYSTRLNQELSESKRYQTPFSLIIININQLARIHNYEGLEAVEDIIEETGKIIKKLIRLSDIGIRYKEDEFIILLPNTSKRGALVMANKLRLMLSEYIFNKQLTLDVGLATFLVDTKKDGVELYTIAKATQRTLKFDNLTGSVKERRKFQRIPMSQQLNINVSIINPPFLNDKIKKLNNISKGGISFHINDLQLKEKDFIEGFVKRDNQEIKFTGQVMWTDKASNGSYAVGVKFI